MNAEIIVDSFAGGGGASLGIAWGTGRAPHIAVNHDGDALAMHAANHPSTKHVREDVWRSDIRKLVGRRRVGLLWASPDCRHFSRAKGGKPVKKEIRSLAWIVVKWAEQVKPRVIVLENVREFEDWGPLLPAWKCGGCGWRGTEGQAVLARTRRRCPRCESLKLAVTDECIPDPDRVGLTFKRWVGRLRTLGYAVQWKALNAADFGAPTHRRRLFLIARRDGKPIVWPEPSHGDPTKLEGMPLFDRLQPWRTAADCIDWSLDCPSIFDRKKELAEKTQRRIAMGLMRYVIENPRPFIVNIERSSVDFRGQSIDDPLNTITAKPKGGKHAVATPYLCRVNHGGEHFRGQRADDPLATVTGHHGYAIAVPYLAQYHQDKAGESRCSPLDEPINTLDTQNRFAHVAATLVQTGYSERDGQAPRALDLDKPLGTVVAGGCKHALAAAMLTKFYGGVVGHGVDQPIGTVTQVDHHALSAVYLARFNHGDKQWNAIDEPVGTVTSQGNKFGLVFAWLVKYFGTAIGQPADEPLHTVTGKHRFGVVMVEVTPGHREPAVAVNVPGVGPCIIADIGPCIIADIGLRMLTPRELARAQGFPDTYLLTGSKANQVAKIGNSVCPQVAAAIVKANGFAPRRRKARVAS